MEAPTLPPKTKPKKYFQMIRSYEPFTPDPKILNDLWSHPDNQTKRNWYVATYTLQQRESFRDFWMTDMKRIRCEIEFFKWFEIYGNLDN